MNKKQNKKGQPEKIRPTFKFTDHRAFFCPETDKSIRLKNEIHIQNFDFVRMDWDISKSHDIEQEKP